MRNLCGCIRSLLTLVALVGLGRESVGQVTESVPLAPAPVPPGAGATLFQKLGPERTGVAFENRFDHPRRWLELWRQYFNGSIGTGVALGDANGDGLPDLFAVGKDSPNALYLNDGDFRFREATAESGLFDAGGFGTGASWADVDNDGDLDLYVCYVAAANQLFLNDGSGRFEEAGEAWGLAWEAGSNAPSFADYDRDGDLDLYLQQNYLYGSEHLDGMPDLLFRNEGDRFVEVTAEAGISGEGQGHVALWWDYDENGWPDLYVTNDFERVDKLYRNNRDGTFTDVIDEALMGAPYSAMGADAADLNNDGHIDFLAAEMLARDRVYYQQAVGPLSGKLLNARRYGVNQYMQNLLSVPVGPGRFIELSRYAGLEATDWTWAARFADLDNDGWQDAFFTNGMARAFHDGDLALRMMQARSLSTRVAVYEKSPPLRERNLAYRNRGAFRFDEVGAAWGLDEEGVSFAAAFADLDRDGDLDVVTSNWKGNLSLFRNNSASGRRLLARLEGVESNRYGIGSRVTLRSGGSAQTKELSLMRGYMGVDAPELHFALPEGEEAIELSIEWPSGARQTVTGLASGRRYVIREAANAETWRPSEEAAALLFRPSSLTAPEGSESREELFQGRRGQFLLPFEEDRLGPPLAVGDFDADGWPDVALGGPGGQPLRVFRNEEGRALRLEESEDFEWDDYAEDSAIQPIALGEEGQRGLLVASGGVELDAGDAYYRDRAYWPDGDGGFRRAEPSRFSVPAEPTRALAVVEVEGLGRVVLTAGGTRPKAYPFTEPNRVFALGENGLEAIDSDWAREFAQSGRSTALLAVDLDADGRTDVVQAREYAEPLLWYQRRGRLERQERIENGATLQGMWRTLEAGDFNGDGLMDVAAGNLGENNKYAVAADKPAALFASRDEAYRGKYIEADWIDGAYYPRESRIFHQVDFQDIAERTGSYEAFARMTVEEAFGEAALERYERFTFRERRSGIFWQTEEGQFRFQPLPDLAQVGVALDLQAADYDADGDLDLFLICESLSPQPAARLHPEESFLTLLENDGRGGFTALWPWRTGLSVSSGQPRAMAWADLDGDGRGELVVACSEGPLHVFSRAVR